MVDKEHVDDSEVAVDEQDDLGQDIASAIEDAEVEIEASAEEEQIQETETVEEAPSDEETPTQPQEDRPVEESKETASPVLAPSSLSPEERQRFDQLPPDAKPVAAEFCERLRNDTRRYLTQETEKLSQLRQGYEGIEKVFEPYREEFRRDGIDLAGALDRYLAWQDQWDEDPLSAAAEVLERYGFRPEDLAAHVQGGGYQPPDPQIEELRQQNEQLQQQYVAFQQHQQQQVIGSVQTAIESFKNAADGEGNLLYPHYAQLEQEMAPQVALIRDQNPQMPHTEVLKTAYERVVWANPDTRKAALAQRNGTNVDKEKAIAADAKRAGSSVKGSPGATGATESIPDTLDDAIHRAMGE